MVHFLEFLYFYSDIYISNLVNISIMCIGRAETLSYPYLLWCCNIWNLLRKTKKMNFTFSTSTKNSIPMGTDHGITLISYHIQAEPWWRASIWRSHRKVVIKQCSYHNNIIDIQNRLPYSKVVYPAIIVLFSCLMDVNHGVRTGPNYPFR